MTTGYKRRGQNPPDFSDLAKCAHRPARSARAAAGRTRGPAHTTLVGGGDKRGRGPPTRGHEGQCPRRRGPDAGGTPAAPLPAQVARQAPRQGGGLCDDRAAPSEEGDQRRSAGAQGPGRSRPAERPAPSPPGRPARGGLLTEHSRRRLGAGPGGPRGKRPGCSAAGRGSRGGAAGGRTGESGEGRQGRSSRRCG